MGCNYGKLQKMECAFPGGQFWRCFLHHFQVSKVPSASFGGCYPKFDGSSWFIISIPIENGDLRVILSTYIFGPFGGEDIQQTRVDLIQGARLVSDENWILRVTPNLYEFI